ncbi:neuropeptides capa receptor [Fopius arisanus]|uniref:FR_1 protein n=1 Tax=Fopius arisanus TaxID=64838 RepID=A0A0C9RGF4_9HYME|nr:PREDICTED: neuropeptides capa receptor [Fopius arisanus]
MKERESSKMTNQSDWAETTMIAIQMYYTPVLVSLGTLGNCLSVYVFFYTKMRRASSSWYLAALVISDTGFLVAVFVVWLNMVGIGIFNLEGYCQFFVYLSTLCSFLSVWFVVSFTVERFIAVQYPLRRQSMCTVAKAKLVLTLITGIGVVLCSPVLWLTSPQPMQHKQNITACLLVAERENFANVFNAADTILTFVLPFTVIVILNGLISRTVWRLANVRRTLTTNGQSRDPKCGNIGVSQATVTKMLLVVSTVFLCFNLPAYVMRVRAFLEVHQDDPRSTVIAQHIANILFDTNFGINFVLYCASGQNFRKAVVRLILRRPRRWHSGTPVSNHVSDVRRSSSKVARQRTIVYEVPWTEGCELREIESTTSRRLSQ